MSIYVTAVPGRFDPCKRQHRLQGVDEGHDLEDHRPFVEEMAAWQDRPLDRIYPGFFIDAIVVKAR